MKYKKKKYLKQNLDLEKLVLKIDFFLAFQLKAVDVSNWVLLKKMLSKHDLKLKVYSTKSLKKNHFFNINSRFVENLYSGKILIVYFKKNIVSTNLIYSELQKLISFFESKSFLVFLHVYFMKKFFSVEKFKDLLKICLLNSKTELIQLSFLRHIYLLKLLNYKKQELKNKN